MKKLLFKTLILMLALLIILPLAGCEDDKKSDSSKKTEQAENNDADKMNSDDENVNATDKTEIETPTYTPPEGYTADYEAVIRVKNYGTMKVALVKSVAPITVENFVTLAKSGFYDGLTFHRIMSGFMIQGGDPQGDGYGGSKQQIKGEFALNGHNNPLSHLRGVISMARSQEPDSASSQFFICHVDSTFLDGQYAAFGYVTEGIEVVDKICASVIPVDGNGTVMPENQPVIESITIS